MSDNTEERVTQIITEQCGYQDQPITLDAKLTEDLDFDSLDIVSIRIDCEEAFGIEIEDEPFLPVVTVGDLVTLVRRLRNG